MKLPPQFDSAESYFHCVVKFLRDYRWIYNFPVTKLLLNDIFSQLPADWSTALFALTNDELNQLPQGLIKDSWPASLISFCEQCSALHAPLLEVNCDDSSLSIIPSNVKQHLAIGPKKLHELSMLTMLVNKECKEQSISTILDIGSGLGYLSQILHHWHGYQVLGLESDDRKVQEATRKQQRLCSSSISVNFITHHITPSSVEFIQEMLQQYFDSFRAKSTEKILEIRSEPKLPPKERQGHISAMCPGCKKAEDNSCVPSLLPDICTQAGDVESVELSARVPPVCMVGLHACGDLTVDAAKIFLQVPEIHSLILMPCCYHKSSLICNTMESDPASSLECFRTFPVSKSLQSVFNSTTPRPSTFLQRPFLRLAAQHTSSHWVNQSEESHRENSMFVMARATLELLAHQEGLSLRKRHRRGVLKGDFLSFDVYIKSAVERYDFLKPDGTKVKARCDIMHKAEQLWAQYSPLCPLAEAVIGLQTMLQALSEQLIMFDRMYFLKEMGGSELDCECVKVFNEFQSPRCLALVCRKI